MAGSNDYRIIVSHLATNRLNKRAGECWIAGTSISQFAPSAKEPVQRHTKDKENFRHKKHLAPEIQTRSKFGTSS
jgi:hypothetical protein